MNAYYFKYFQNIEFKNHGIAPTPPYLPTLKAYPTPGVGGRFEIFLLKWRERMNLKVPGATLPLGCAILSTRARTVRGVGTTPLRRTRVKRALDKYNIILQLSPKKDEIFILLEVLACVMTACWILHSSLIYFWRNMHISSIFYFSKSTSINTQYSSLWDTWS